MARSCDAAQLDILDVPVAVVFLTSRPSDPLYKFIQTEAKQVGLLGPVVAVWPDPFGRTCFLAPPGHHAFFEVASYRQLQAQISLRLLLPDES